MRPAKAGPNIVRRTKMYKIEFYDDGILRNCTAESRNDAIVMFDIFTRVWPHVYMWDENSKIVNEYHAE